MLANILIVIGALSFAIGLFGLMRSLRSRPRQKRQ